jgi:hypothetical protein
MEIDYALYGKAALIGFLLGALVFVVVSPLAALNYFEQFWLLLGCMSAGVALSCAVALVYNRYVEQT